MNITLEQLIDPQCFRIGVIDGNPQQPTSLKEFIKRAGYDVYGIDPNPLEFGGCLDRRVGGADDYAAGKTLQRVDCHQSSLQTFLTNLYLFHGLSFTERVHALVISPKQESLATELMAYLAQLDLQMTIHTPDTYWMQKIPRLIVCKNENYKTLPAAIRYAHAGHLMDHYLEESWPSFLQSNGDSFGIITPDMNKVVELLSQTWSQTDAHDLNQAFIELYSAVHHTKKIYERSTKERHYLLLHFYITNGYKILFGDTVPIVPYEGERGIGIQRIFLEDDIISHGHTLSEKYFIDAGAISAPHNGAAHTIGYDTFSSDSIVPNTVYLIISSPEKCTAVHANVDITYYITSNGLCPCLDIIIFSIEDLLEGEKQEYLSTAINSGSCILDVSIENTGTINDKHITELVLSQSLNYALAKEIFLRSVCGA